MTMLQSNIELAGSIRLAMSLLPEDELLCEVEASNNGRVERSTRASWPMAGLIEVKITTLTAECRERHYELLDGRLRCQEDRETLLSRARMTCDECAVADCPKGCACACHRQTNPHRRAE